MADRIIEYVRKDGTKSKEWANGKTLLNATNLNALANNLQTIITWRERLPSWIRENNAAKPSYTAVEVGADKAGTASTLVGAHNASVDAHAGLFAKINHTHNINTIVGFPQVVSKTAFSYQKASVLTRVEDEGDLTFRSVSPVVFSGDFRDLINAPTNIPTRVSELDNDAGYLTSSDLTQISKGSWLGGTMRYYDEWSTFVTGFRPDYVYITYKVNGKDHRCMIDCRKEGWQNAVWIYEIKGTNRIEVDFINCDVTDFGFLLQDTAPGQDDDGHNDLNIPGVSYKYVAVGRGVVDLPYVSYEDEGKMLQVVDGQWEKINPTEKVLPDITPECDGALLMARYEEQGGKAYSEWQKMSIANGQQFGAE